MPEAVTQKENQLSLLSIEVLISHVNINLNIECHLPCMVFRLLDYPAVSIPYFDQWQIGEFHNLKKNYPNLTWRQVLSDQFYELRSANGNFNFKRGKSCLFKSYFKTLYRHLLNVPLFILLIDQINDDDTNKSNFIGSCNVKLNELIEILNQSIIKNGNDIPLVEQQTFHCTLFNLMGSTIGTCDIAVRFCHYGTTILTQLPMLDDEKVTETEKKTSTASKEQISDASTILPPTDALVKHIHVVNEKRDVGLQLSHGDLPFSPSSTSINNKSAQTRWTTTKTRSNDVHHSKGRYSRTIEDPLFDDPAITFYQPPPLYFNSDSDFLQIATTESIKTFEQAKDNRLSYLASVPIISFDDDENDNENHESSKSQTKRKSTGNVHFNLSSSTSSKILPNTKIIPKQKKLDKDFLHNFPLLRSLVEEALALQQLECDIPISIRNGICNKRPHSARVQKQNDTKQIPIRPKSTMSVHSMRTKSVIVSRNINNTHRLVPSSSKTNQIFITKHNVRDLVDRLSKPKVNKRVEQQMRLFNENISHQESVIKTPSASSKPSTIGSSTATIRKPPPAYGTTRAHRLMAEYSRARRAALQPQPITSPKSQKSPKNEPTSNSHTPSLSSPQIVNTTTGSRLSLLNRVDVETPTIQKNIMQRPSLEFTPENTVSILKSVSSTSHDASLKLNQTITKVKFSTPESTILQQNQEDDEHNDDLRFSITDITDYFTDGEESGTHATSRQST